MKIINCSCHKNFAAICRVACDASGVYTIVHVRRTCTPYRCTAYMYDSVNIHRTCTPYMCDECLYCRTCTSCMCAHRCTPYIYGRDLILLWPRPIFRGCHGAIRKIIYPSLVTRRMVDGATPSI